MDEAEYREVARSRMREWYADPLRFVTDCLRAEPDPWQAETLAGLRRGPRTAIVGSKGCGKTAVEAWAMLWWLATRRESNIAATSISGDNLRDGLWKEAALWLGRSRILGAQFEWSTTRIVSKTHPATWWASARTWARTADANRQSETLAGLHSRYMMFVIDEAGGIPRPIMVTAEAALASGKECKLLIGGNPTNLDGPLYQSAVTHKADWSTVHINGDPDDPKRSTRVDADWARQQIAAYGADNPWVIVNVFGQFPPSSINALLGPEDVLAAQRRVLKPSQYEWAQKRLGVDVARFGDDRTVIVPRQGLYSGRPVIMRNADTVTIASRVVAAQAKWHSEVTLVDDTGHWGHGVIDNLNALGHQSVGVVFSAKATNPRYKNRRAEMWLEMAKWVKAGGRLPNYPDLLGELITPTYTFVGGQFVLEEKDQIKERLGRSPDVADALALTFAIADLPGALIQQARGQDHAETDFDPYVSKPARRTNMGSSGPGRAIHDWDPYA